MDGLPRLAVARAIGTEPFTENGRLLGFDLLSFWQWSSSDLVVNVVRGLLAEYIVAQALDIADSVRDPWQRWRHPAIPMSRRGRFAEWPS